jgi:hypothetical protein
MAEELVAPPVRHEVRALVTFIQENLGKFSYEQFVFNLIARIGELTARLPTPLSQKLNTIWLLEIALHALEKEDRASQESLEVRRLLLIITT